MPSDLYSVPETIHTDLSVGESESEYETNDPHDPAHVIELLGAALTFLLYELFTHIPFFKSLSFVLKKTRRKSSLEWS